MHLNKSHSAKSYLPSCN